LERKYNDLQSGKKTPSSGQAQVVLAKAPTPTRVAEMVTLKKTPTNEMKADVSYFFKERNWIILILTVCFFFFSV
jgi:hypothetical protein